MKQLQILYDKEKCIGAAFCESIDPEHFVVKGDKAELIGGTHDKKNIFILEISADAMHKKNIIGAAMSCPVNAISVKDLMANTFIVASELVTNKAKQISATYDEEKEWKADIKGYFLIRIDKENKMIEAGHCIERNIVDMKISGKTATDIFNTIIRENLISSMQHASYLGKELYKAELALKHKLKYVQDEDLKIR